MSRTNTQSISIASPPERVFAFVADPQKQPVWAIGFCKEIWEEDGRWIVTTPSGEQIPMRSVANPELGTTGPTTSSRWCRLPGCRTRCSTHRPRSSPAS